MFNRMTKNYLNKAAKSQEILRYLTRYLVLNLISFEEMDINNI